MYWEGSTIDSAKEKRMETSGTKGSVSP
jgi:hypothetical protein